MKNRYKQLIRYIILPFVLAYIVSGVVYIYFPDTVLFLAVWLSVFIGGLIVNAKS